MSKISGKARRDWKTPEKIGKNPKIGKKNRKDWENPEKIEKASLKDRENDSQRPGKSGAPAFSDLFPSRTRSRLRPSLLRKKAGAPRRRKERIRPFFKCPFAGGPSQNGPLRRGPLSRGPFAQGPLRPPPTASRPSVVEQPSSSANV